ncbi:hypothetical protein [Stieleria varia]|uniref:Uncharacterized protein n=1 Tax=Stieleria varia TaxID=2528005 RepID=A0A5C6A0H1_9BACT|nr:hypothetical protein [Stieleria varia]TWT92791.1 hypothetical protein Pla52n_61560 [Stieleria varia]
MNNSLCQINVPCFVTKAVLAFAILLCGMNDHEAIAQVIPGQTDQFAGSLCKLAIVPPKSIDQPRVTWRLTTANRTLGQGVSELGPVAIDDDTRDEKPNTKWVFAFKTPDLDDGVVLSVDLYFHFGDPSAEIHHPIRLHATDCFTAVHQTIQDHGIAIYDPTGDTLAALQPLSLNPRVVSSLKHVDDEAIVVLGEAIAWDKRTMQYVKQLVADGKWVIVLRPTDESQWPLPLSATSIRNLEFKPLVESRWIPKKLDAKFFDQVTGWELRVSRGELLLAPAIGPQIFQLAEYQSQADHGGCLFVGVSLVERWKTSPVPRELLKHMLVHILPKQQPIQNP